MKRLPTQVTHWFHDRERAKGGSGAASEPDVTADPTPIWSSRRTRTALLLAMLLGVGVVVWYVPSVLSTLIGGFALALVLLIQGAISTVGLLLLGVPYALALGALVSVTALIPYLGPGSAPSPPCSWCLPYRRRPRSSRGSCTWPSSS